MLTLIGLLNAFLATTCVHQSLIIMRLQAFDCTINYRPVRLWPNIIIPFARFPASVSFHRMKVTPAALHDARRLLGVQTIFISDCLLPPDWPRERLRLGRQGPAIIEWSTDDITSD